MANEDGSDDDNTPIKWCRITEHNSWEDETWYHYFDATDEKVSNVLSTVVAKHLNTSDLDSAIIVELSMNQAEILANVEPGYMDTHWFGELTDVDKLLAATSDNLYKGKIRDFGEELFSREEV